MIKDHTAHLIKQQEQNWQSLVEAEARLEAAKAAARKARDEKARKEAGEARKGAQADIKALCEPLAKQLPHFGLHYLDATKLSDEHKKGEREGKKQFTRRLGRSDVEATWCCGSADCRRVANDQLV
jgi:hypothetical protein